MLLLVTGPSRRPARLQLRSRHSFKTSQEGAGEGAQNIRRGRDWSPRAICSYWDAAAKTREAEPALAKTEEVKSVEKPAEPKVSTTDKAAKPDAAQSQESEEERKKRLEDEEFERMVAEAEGSRTEGTGARERVPREKEEAG